MGDYSFPYLASSLLEGWSLKKRGGQIFFKFGVFQIRGVTFKGFFGELFFFATLIWAK